MMSYMAPFNNNTLNTNNEIYEYSEWLETLNDNLEAYQGPEYYQEFENNQNLLEDT